MKAFLETGQDIWDWAADNIKVEAKPQDFCANIAKNVKKALESEIDNAEILAAVFAGGVTPQSIMVALEEMAKQEEIAALEAVVASGQAVQVAA